MPAVFRLRWFALMLLALALLVRVGPLCDAAAAAPPAAMHAAAMTDCADHPASPSAPKKAQLGVCVTGCMPIAASAPLNPTSPTRTGELIYASAPHVLAGLAQGPTTPPPRA
jgi:hypothetical protein